MFVNLGLLRQGVIVLPAILGELTVGFICGWTAPTIERLLNGQEHFTLTISQCAWVASLPELGRSMGTLIVPLVLDVIGRRKMFIFCAFFYFVSWVMVYTSHSAPFLYIAKIICGLMFGADDATTPIYLGEMCKPRFRALMSNLSVSFYFFGILISFIICTYLPFKTVALAFAIFQFVMLVLIALVARETPHFLIMKGRTEEARETYRWLCASDKVDAETIDSQFEHIVENVRSEKSKLSTKEILADKANRRSILTGLAISVLSVANGGPALTSFVSVALAARASYLSASHLTILFGVFQLISIYLSSAIVGYFNRRTILITGFGLSCVIHACSAVLYYFEVNSDIDIPNFEWYIFTTITLFAVVFSSAILPLGFVLRGEMYPLRVKPLGSCLSVSSNAIVSFATTEAFLHISQYWGIYANFVLYSVASFVAVLFTYFCMPETKGKSLDEIRKLFMK